MKNIDYKFRIIVGLSATILILILALIWNLKELKESKEEADRHKRNYAAVQDSVVIISSENETLLAQRLSLELYYEELRSENLDLIQKLDVEKRKKTKVVIQTVVEYRDSSIYVPVISRFNQKTPELYFSYKPTLKGKNYLSIEGILPYSISYDTSKILMDSLRLGWRIIPKINTESAHLKINQKIDLITGLVRDSKSGKLYVRASTDFPGISFAELNSINLLDDGESKRALRNSRKPFGIGFGLGLGLTSGPGGFVGLGPNVVIGVTYSPKFLQFGK